jgi:hypothetical protein
MQSVDEQNTVGINREGRARRRRNEGRPARESVVAASCLLAAVCGSWWAGRRQRSSVSHKPAVSSVLSSVDACWLARGECCDETAAARPIANVSLRCCRARRSSKHVQEGAIE